MNQHCYTDWDETVRTCQLISIPSLPTQPIKPVHTLPGPRLFLFTSSSLGSFSTSSPGRFSLALGAGRDKRPGDEVGSFWVSVKRGVRDSAGGGAEFGVYHTVLGLVLGLGSGKG